MDRFDTESLPENEEVLKLRNLYPDLSRESCELLYSKYGGTADRAANCILDDMMRGDFQDINLFLEALSINKENEASSENSPEWMKVVSPRRPGSELGNNKLQRKASVKLTDPKDKFPILRAPKGFSKEDAKQLLNTVIQTGPETRRLFEDVIQTTYPKLLIILRGVSGCGKSSVAKSLFSVTENGVICSADDFFLDRYGEYNWNPSLLEQAHQQCKATCHNAMEHNLSPVIIDNTNTRRFEMESYVEMAIRHNYFIKLIEPETSWKTDSKILSRKNTHNVPRSKIQEMLKRYEQIMPHMLINDVRKKLNGIGECYKPEIRDRSFNEKLEDGVALSAGSPTIMPSFDFTIPSSLLLTPPSNKKFIKAASLEAQYTPPPVPNLSEYVCDGLAKPSTPRRQGMDKVTNDGYLNETFGGSTRMAAIFPIFKNYMTVSGCEDVISENLKDQNISFTTGQEKRARSKSGSLLTDDSKRESMSLTPTPPLEVDKNILSHTQTLLKYFPTCGREELVHWFQMCNGDINETINSLLDSGYEIVVDESVRRQSECESAPVTDEATRTNAQKQNNSQKLDPEFQAESVSSKIPEVSGTDEKYRLLGARSKILQQQHSTESFKDELEDIDKITDDTNFQDENDGEDWLDLELPMPFINVLSGLYGTPNEKDVDSITKEDRTIRLPPVIAFDLFRYLSANIVKRQNEAQERALLLDADAFNVPDEGSQNQPDGLSNNVYDYIEQDEDMDRILKQIQDLEKDSSDEPKTFKSIVQQDELEAHDELVRLEEIRSIKRSMAQNIKFAQLRHAFPSLNSKIVDDIFVQSELNYEKALNSLKELYPLKFTNPVCKSVENPVCQSNSRYPDTAEVSYDPDKVAHMTSTEKREMLELAENWKIQFEDLNNATLAYKQNAKHHRGQQEVFSYFMVKAAETQKLMRQAQREHWFYTVIGLNAGNKNPNKIDLHGLSVQHALEVVNNYLENRKAWVKNHVPMNTMVKLNIITGMGRHSINNIPKVNPAVRNFLQMRHYSFQDTSNGSFSVHIIFRKDTKGAAKKSIKRLN